MTRWKRIFGGTLAAVAWWAVSCRDVPAPEGGVHSISKLILPLPGLVAGDTMRDTLGLVAPLNVIAFGADLQPLDPQPEISFVVLDTGAHIVDGRFLVGDDAGTTVRVVGTVGSLQTQPAPVKVTVEPDTLVAADSITHRVFYRFPPDTIAQAALNVNVRNLAAGTGVEAVLVNYSIDRAPASVNDLPTVVLVNGSVLSARDTSEASGRASRTARLRVLSLPATSTVDTAVVSATASYRGAPLGTVQFIIVYEVRGATAVRNEP